MLTYCVKVFAFYGIIDLPLSKIDLKYLKIIR